MDPNRVFHESNLSELQVQVQVHVQVRFFDLFFELNKLIIDCSFFNGFCQLFLLAIRLSNLLLITSIGLFVPTQVARSVLEATTQTLINLTCRYKRFILLLVANTLPRFFD